MNTILTVGEARALVASTLTDDALQVVLDREAAALLARYGPPGDGATEVTETMQPTGRSVFLARPIVSVTSVSERRPGGSDQLAVSTAYEVWPEQGRIERVSGCWLPRVTVVYVPVDQRPEYQAALIDLLRLTVGRTALKAESIASEYSYTAPDWEAERQQVYRQHRLSFLGV